MAGVGDGEALDERLEASLDLFREAVLGLLGWKMYLSFPIASSGKFPLTTRSRSRRTNEHQALPGTPNPCASHEFARPR